MELIILELHLHLHLTNLLPIWVLLAVVLVWGVAGKHESADQKFISGS